MYIIYYILFIIYYDSSASCVGVSRCEIEFSYYVLFENDDNII